MIAAWMVYSKEWATARDALTFYAAMRTYNQKGVTIPSQIRYVHYFEESLQNPPETKTLLLNKIIFHTLPKVTHLSDINFVVSVGKTSVYTHKEFEEKTKEKKWVEGYQRAQEAQKEDRQRRGRGGRDRLFRVWQHPIVWRHQGGIH